MHDTRCKNEASDDPASLRFTVQTLPAGQSVKHLHLLSKGLHTLPVALENTAQIARRSRIGKSRNECQVEYGKRVSLDRKPR
jgi:hypothetical protein